MMIGCNDDNGNDDGDDDGNDDGDGNGDDNGNDYNLCLLMSSAPAFIQPSRFVLSWISRCFTIRPFVFLVFLVLFALFALFYVFLCLFSIFFIFLVFMSFVFFVLPGPAVAWQGPWPSSRHGAATPVSRTGSSRRSQTGCRHRKVGNLTVFPVYQNIPPASLFVSSSMVNTKREVYDRKRHSFVVKLTRQHLINEDPKCPPVYCLVVTLWREI